jgi:hypothetical protein
MIGILSDQCTEKTGKGALQPLSTCLAPDGMHMTE